MLCREQPVKFWRVVDSTTHELLYTGLCAEVQDNMYIEYPDGSKEFINLAPLNETSWDWAQVPETENVDILRFIDNMDIKSLVKIANRYQVAGYSLCCDTDFVLKQFEIYARSIKSKND